MISLLFVELLMTIMFLTINDLSHLWILLIFIFIRMSAASMYFSTEMSLLAKLLDGKNLQTANEINSIVWSFTYAVGMATSGFIVNLYGVKTAIMVDVFIFVLAIIVFLQIKLNIEHKKVTEKIIKEELENIKEYVREKRYDSGKFELATQLFSTMIFNENLDDFLTLEAYKHLK
jgi:MFS family permease